MAENSSIQSAASSLGSTIGGSIIDGIKSTILEPRQGWLTDILDYISGNMNPSLNRMNLSKFADTIDRSNPYAEDFLNQMSTALIGFTGQEITEAEFRTMYDDYVNLRKDGYDISKLKVENAFGDILGLFDPNMVYTYDKSSKQISDIGEKIHLNGDMEVDYLEFTDENIEKIINDTFDGLDDKAVKNVTDMFSRAINDEDYNYGSQLYEKQVKNDQTGKYGLKLSQRGEFLLKEIAKYAKENPDIMNKTISAAFMRDKAYEIMYSEYGSSLSNIKKDVNNLLTEHGFKQEDFNADEILTIMNRAEVLDSFEVKDNHLIVKDDVTDESILALLGIVSEISDKVTDGDKQENKTIEEIARNAGGIEKLTKLNNDARGGNASASQELNRLTNNLGYTGLMSSIESRYGVLQTFMKNATDKDYLNGNYILLTKYNKVHNYLLSLEAKDLLKNI